MRDEDLTMELKGFDYSLMHPVRESLKEKLLNMHRMANRSTDLWQDNKLTDDELDYAAAAGNANIQGRSSNKGGLNDF
jgi:hypothetical protein